jgi:hypothetical protein
MPDIGNAEVQSSNKVGDSPLVILARENFGAVKLDGSVFQNYYLTKQL